MTSGGSDSLKHPTIDTTLWDVVLRLDELAVSCTVERTASRPSIAHIANRLQAVREEVAGKEESGDAIKGGCASPGDEGCCCSGRKSKLEGKAAGAADATLPPPQPPLAPQR
ncbi:unnamed protein product [Closterium sp. NIES-64]|nr:unnamed protein product [Closterium sp. NIES-64]